MNREIRISGLQRTKQREKVLLKQCYQITPPKYTYRESLWNKYNKFALKYGYDIEHKGNSPILYEMQQNFMQKTVKYLGEGHKMKKMGRVDKIKRKQELGIDQCLKTNPIIEKYGKLS